MKANKPMTSEQLNELMTVAVNMQRDAETDCKRPSAMFAYAVQVAVLELCKVRNDAAALAAENAGLKSIQEWAVSGVFKSGAKVFESTKASGFDTDDCLHDAVLVMLSELKTPATDAFLAEVRAQGLNAFIQHHSAELDAHIKNGGEQFDEKSVRIRDIIVSARLFREQIRKGVQS
ncbi:hypothetical protein [Enterobacter roggenkampii]|uniref:hypothetical protein n=1 Tax=Enterobacter roggenkampii TaxID=1812935 RepID=UPI001E4B158A|nr:hypothetical protein [Enterobacter roggenkampii]MCE1461062.1 hypothetical protein [Enterobacter roggenkampii]